MTLPPYTTNLIRQGAGYQVALAVYEMVKRHSGMVHARREDPSVAWALSTARRLMERHDSHDQEIMESCVIVLAVALPQEFQDLSLLRDADAVREWPMSSRKTAARKRQFPP